MASYRCAKERPCEGSGRLAVLAMAALSLMVAGCQTATVSEGRANGPVATHAPAKQQVRVVTPQAPVPANPTPPFLPGKIDLKSPPTPEPTEPLASATKGSVALLLPLSGPASAVGQALLDAAQLALFEIADDEFTFLIYDTAGEPSSAEDAARLAISEGAELILGPLFAGSATAVRAVAGPAGVNVVAFSNDRSVAGDGVYILGYMPDQQIQRVVAHAVAKGYRRLGMLASAGAYADAVDTSFRDAARRTGAEIARIVLYQTGVDMSEVVRDFADYDARRSALARQKAALAARGDQISKLALDRLQGLETLGDPPYDALLLPQGGGELRNLAPLLAFYDVDPTRIKLLGTTQWDAAQWEPQSGDAKWDEAGLGAEPSLRGAWFPAPSPHERQAFFRRFRQAFGSAPPPIASLAYDATALAAVLAQSEGGPDYGLEALTDPSGFAGVDGIFRLLSTGLTQRGYSVIEVNERGQKVIDPAPTRFDEATN